MSFFLRRPRGHSFINDSRDLRNSLQISFFRLILTFLNNVDNLSHMLTEKYKLENTHRHILPAEEVNRTAKNNAQKNGEGAKVHYYRKANIIHICK